MKPRRIVIRLGPPSRPPGRRTLALLLLVLAVPLFSQDSLTFNAYFPSPLGMFSRLLTTGVTTNTLLARFGGGVGIGPGMDTGVNAPKAALVVSGVAVAGGNSGAPPSTGQPGGSGLATLNVTGPASGFALGDRSGNGSRWSGYSSGSVFTLAKDGGGVRSIAADGRFQTCTLKAYDLGDPGGDTCSGSPCTKCPAAYPFVYFATNQNGNGHPIPFWDWSGPGNPQPPGQKGQILCCAECPPGGNC